MQQLQPEIETYQVALAEYDRELPRREPLLAAYNQQLSKYQNSITVFEEIVEGYLTNPQEIWDKLTDWCQSVANL